MLSRSDCQFQTEAGAGRSKPTPGQEWLAASGWHFFPVLVIALVVGRGRGAVVVGAVVAVEDTTTLTNCYYC